MGEKQLSSCQTPQRIKSEGEKQCQALLFLRECDRPRLTLEYKRFALKSQVICFKFDRFKNIDLMFLFFYCIMFTAQKGILIIMTSL